MKISHRDKKRMARQMRTHAEIKAKVPPFQSKAWLERRIVIEKRIQNHDTT